MFASTVGSELAQVNIFLYEGNEPRKEQQLFSFGIDIGVVPQHTVQNANPLTSAELLSLIFELVNIPIIALERRELACSICLFFRVSHFRLSLNPCWKVYFTIRVLSFSLTVTSTLISLGLESNPLIL